VTAIIDVLRPYVPVLSLGVLYVFAVLVAAVLWGVAYALPVAAASMLAFDWYYLSLGHRMALNEAHNVLTLAVYAVTAVVVSGLAARSRQRADISEQVRDRLEGEQAALRRVAILVARGVPPADIFQAVTREVAKLLNADICHLVRHEADHTVTVVACSAPEGPGAGAAGRWRLERQDVPDLGRILAAGNDGARGLGPASSVSTPIVVDGRHWGVVIASSARPLPDPTAARLSEFAELVATAISNSHAREQLEASRARIVAAADDVRRRIERDLHDGTQQRLVSLALALRAAEASVPDDLRGLRAELSRVVDGLVEALEDLREISQGIHPAILAEGGLGPALRALARRSPLPVEVAGDLGNRFPPELEVAAYYVVSEAVTNAAKHAAASVVRVEVEVAGETLRVTVRDDGVGGADPARGSGLTGLGDRVEALGGRISVTSPPGKGTTIVVALPMRRTPGPQGPEDAR
jgi:signal transduction histidine kinase